MGKGFFGGGYKGWAGLKRSLNGCLKQGEKEGKHKGLRKTTPDLQERRKKLMENAKKFVDRIKEALQEMQHSVPQ